MKKSEYKKLVKKTEKKYDALHKVASDALAEAVKLSEETGVPFSWPGQGGYIPKSLPITEFTTEFLSEVTGFDEYYFEDGGETGWLSSYC